MEYIKDEKGKFIGTTWNNGNKTYVKEFVGKIVSTYNKDTNQTLDWKNNKLTKGDVSLRFLK